MTPTPQISPMDALKLLDDAIATVNMNRASHENARQCIVALQIVIAQHKEQALSILTYQDEIEEKNAQIVGLKEQLRMALGNAEGAAPPSELSEC